MKKLFQIKLLVVLFGSLFFDCSLQASSQDAVQREEVFIFFRGYHFLTNQQASDEALAQRGISTRSVDSGEVAQQNVDDAIEKICSLNRSWTQEEKDTFKPETRTPYQALVQCYTNNYMDFIAQLNSPDSMVHKILNSAGLGHVKSNFFLSTSLKAAQAFAYGAGLKLYGTENLRRYPGYALSADKKSYKPAQPLLGYVDVIRVPYNVIQQLAAFFVVDSFTVGDTKLSYHFSKNLTEEREVIFPFQITAPYHVARIAIRMPKIKRSGLQNGMQQKHWFTALQQDKDKRNIEAKFIVAHNKKSAEKLEMTIEEKIKAKNNVRVYHGSILQGLQRSLVPKEAVEMRKQILDHENEILHMNSKNEKRVVSIANLSFPYAHALKRVASYGVPVMLKAQISLKTLDQNTWQLMGIFMSENSLLGIKFEGDPQIVEQLCEKFKATDFRDYRALNRMQTLWFDPQPNLLDVAGSFVKKRQQPLVFDVSGLGLAPEYFEQSQDMTNLVVVDDERQELEEAYNWVMDGADWWGDYCRKELR